MDNAILLQKHHNLHKEAELPVAKQNNYYKDRLSVLLVNTYMHKYVRDTEMYTT